MVNKERNTKLAYSMDEGLDLIGMNHTAGYKAMNSGELETYKVGRRRMVTHKALEKYVVRKEREGRAAA